MIGGMSTWVFIRHGMPWPLAGLCALAVGAAASLVVERFTWRWMRNAQEFVPLVSSMAFLILFENLAVVLLGSELQSAPCLVVIPTKLRFDSRPSLGCDSQAVQYPADLGDLIENRCHVGREHLSHGPSSRWYRSPRS